MTRFTTTQGLQLKHRSGGQCEWTVDAVKQVTYQVITANDLFQPDSTLLLQGCDAATICTGERRLVVIDSNVERLHGARIRAYFARHGVGVTLLPIRAEETTKAWDSVVQVVEAMNDFRIDRRREPVIAIGGGVLLDIVGFAASVYRRGTPYVRIPTTLIGLVDAGVGVKTGVNFGRGKNRIGTYAPATATYVDRRFLATVDARHLSNGIAEILKVALIKSRPLFDLLEREGAALIDDRFQGSTPELDAAAEEVVSSAIHLMLEELQPNLWEACLERCVDYGHTFSPTLEMEALPALLHGEAVCIDMALTTVLAWQRGDVSTTDADRVLRTMHALTLPTWTDVLARPGLLDDALADTVRHRDGEQRLPLPIGIGRHRFVNDVTADDISSALETLAVVSRALSGGPVPGLLPAAS